MKLTQIKVGSILSLPILSDLVAVLNSFQLLGTTIWPTQIFDFEPSDSLVWVIPVDFPEANRDQISAFLSNGLDGVIVTQYDVVFSLTTI